MKARIDLMHVTSGVIQAMLGLERQVRQAGFDHRLLDLVRMRASQINGGSYQFHFLWSLELAALAVE